MLTPLAWLLGATALLAGVTGAWSPCGFSMVDTLSSGGGGRRRVTLVSCATFACGALLGGVVTFGMLSLVGAALRGAGAAAPVAVAAAIAGAAALGEARGVRIVPQVRRQVPEPWRRVLPLPLAAWLYGILLGLGFTTFVLTLAVWALAGICVALGDPELGIVIGLGFGIGRALPVVALAPVARRRTGVRALALMAERPLVLRGLRLADAAGLAVCAAVIAAGPAAAAVVVATGSDPSAAGNDLAWQAPDGTGKLRLSGRVFTLPGRDPAIGGRMMAWHRGSLVTVARRDAPRVVLTTRVPGVDKLAVSDRWLVYRARGQLWGRRLSSPRRALRIARGQVGRPALNGDTVVYSITGRAGSAIAAVDLRRRHGRVIRWAQASQFLNPSLLAGRLLYVGESDCSQLLRLGLPDRRRERFLVDLAPIARHDSGHEPGHTEQGSETSICPGGVRRAARDVLWTTALSRRYAYVTVLRFGAAGLGSPRILRIRR
ncbi:MAG: hypothetical protein QOH11_2222 [Solirubrobacteraceae bacterium]|nr:hypothetical protein [Solirubrobacteraceae bacterium]